MFTQTWKKYLAVIVILMKRSANSEQSLAMNHTDFERAAGGRKIKYSFNNLYLNNGRIDNTFKLSPVAREFAEVLQENELTKALLRQQQFAFTMNNDFQLTIKNLTPVSAHETVSDTDSKQEA
jgi:hypothetical protein